jgi:hypothetical protein
MTAGIYGGDDAKLFADVFVERLTGFRTNLLRKFSGMTIILIFRNDGMVGIFLGMTRKNKWDARLRGHDGSI